MKKIFCLLVFITTTALAALSQDDMGYRTTDVGGAAQYQPDGLLLHLHLAFNAKIHNSIVFQAGYNKTKSGSPLHDEEDGTGWGGSIGYRYYFDFLPRKFFLGFNVGAWKMDVKWSKTSGTGNSSFVFIQPAAELGYTFLFNDQFFITPYITGSYQVKANSENDNIAYGSGFVPMAGLSMGWRF